MSAYLALIACGYCGKGSGHFGWCPLAFRPQLMPSCASCGRPTLFCVCRRS